MTTPNAPSARMTANPGDFVVFERAVVYSCVWPAVIEIGVERSLYPSSFSRRVWSPGVRPGMVAGQIPLWMPSRKMAAPAGVVITERDPVPAVCGWLLVSFEPEAVEAGFCVPDAVTVPACPLTADGVDPEPDGYPEDGSWDPVKAWVVGCAVTGVVTAGADVVAVVAFTVVVFTLVMPGVAFTVVNACVVMVENLAAVVVNV